MKTAIVHDWLSNYAGSERVVESFTNLFPEADIYTLVDFLNDDERKIILKDKKPTVSFIQKLPGARKNFRKYLPLFPYAIEQFDLSQYDLIISSSHAVAKGVLTHANQLHICYCHTPIRYAWDLTHQYLREANLLKGVKAGFAKFILHYIRNWDINSTSRVDYFIANSNYIARRIKKIYRRDAEVIYPPVDTGKFSFNRNKEEFYLAASRLVPYKRIDLIASAFKKMPDKKLVIIGDGADRKKVEAIKGDNIIYLGHQPLHLLRGYMEKAKAFVFAAEEDFGIMIIESMAAGTPVIAFGKGGAVETVIDGETGIFFNEQNEESIIKAVERFEAIKDNFIPSKLNSHSLKFERKIFEEKIESYIDENRKLFFK
jgi:glycosyltransferase involved in cell wall biosynthesis